MRFAEAYVLYWQTHNMPPKWICKKANRNTFRDAQSHHLERWKGQSISATGRHRIVDPGVREAVNAIFVKVRGLAHGITLNNKNGPGETTRGAARCMRRIRSSQRRSMSIGWTRRTNWHDCADVATRWVISYRRRCLKVRILAHGMPINNNDGPGKTTRGAARCMRRIGSSQRRSMRIGRNNTAPINGGRADFLMGDGGVTRA